MGANWYKVVVGPAHDAIGLRKAETEVVNTPWFSACAT